MTVLTISRQLGSLGTTLGRLVAARLKYQIVQREVINEAARLTHLPGMALATIDELGLLGIEPEEDEQDAYLKAVRTVIGEMAQKGKVVIVGRAGQAILKNHPNAFHLRVIAPLETRIKRIVKAHHITRQAAKAQIRDSDTYRAKYLKSFYNVRWDEPTQYHLIINTGLLDLETSAEIVSTAVRSFLNRVES